MNNLWEQVTILQNPIVEYIRDRRNNKIGVLVSGIVANTDSAKTVDEVVVGWSLCSKYDDFDRFKGIEIASGRAYSNDKFTYQINGNMTKLNDMMPAMVQYSLVDFVARVKRYYKTTKFSDFAEMFYI